MSSLERAVDILRIMATSDSSGSRLQDLTEATGLPRPTVHRLLTSMKSLGLVDQDPTTERYLIGLDLYLLGESSADRYNLMEMGRPIVEGLAIDTGDTTYLTVRHRFESICVFRAEGRYPIKAFTTQVGSSQPLGLGVGSIALLACLDDREIEEVIQHNRGVLQSNGTFDMEELRRLIEKTKTEGYVIRKSAVVTGITTMAVPVRDHLRRPLASISLTAIESRLSEERLPFVIEQCKEAAAKLEQRIAIKPLGPRPNARD